MTTRLPTKYQEGLKRCLFAYMDGLLIFSGSFEEHLIHVRKILQRLRYVNLLLTPKKCSFATTEVALLGFLVGKDGVRCDPTKLRPIKKLPAPRNITENRSILGMFSFYRRFIPNFAQIAHPLTELTGKNVPFIWTEKCQMAFETLQEKSLSAPVLAPFNQNWSIQIHTDASKIGIGAVLMQAETLTHQPNPIAYASRILNKHEKNYSITELEGLAVIFALQKFRNYTYLQDTYVLQITVVYVTLLN
jgi:hypothetical protein